jgi:FG-GAP repeat/Abnormal spindle-like microcephaly-assoc'd, ASPM-SPD-2-Hydin
MRFSHLLAIISVLTSLALAQPVAHVSLSKEKSASGWSNLPPDAQHAIRAALEGDDPVWIQQAELTASDGAAYGQFGTSVAISGNTLVVGAVPYYLYSSPNPGAVYIFVESGGTWSQQAKLTASDGVAGDQFGWSVAVDGSTVVVGSPFNVFSLTQGPGAAYVFVENGGTWSQQAELTASDGVAGDEFGWTVAVSGSTITAGAPCHPGSYAGNGAYECGPGAVYTFVQNDTNWTQQAELTSSDGLAGDRFGGSVVINGSTAVVGAPSHSVGSNQTGAAYVFVESGATWSQQAELTASDGVSGDGFGDSVAVIAGTIVVGAPAHPQSSPLPGPGAAYVFGDSSGTWVQQAELSPSDGAAFDLFGISVAISGSTVMVGAPNHPYSYTSSAPGAAYVFVESGGWSQQQELTPSDGGGYFGDSISLSGNTAVAGAPFHIVGSSSLQGAAYVFSAGPTFTLSASPNPLSVIQGGQSTSTITITPVNGFSGSVSFAASGLPSGVTATFTPNPATSTSTLTLTATNTATIGTATVIVTATSGNLTQTMSLTLAVTSFTLIANPNSLSLAQAGSIASTITIAPVNGFGGLVSLSASGLPSGVTAVFNPNPVISTNTSELILTASGTATLGTTTVTVTGSSGNLTETVTLTLTVTPPPTFTLSANPSSLSVERGGQGTSTITITPANGFGGSVSLSGSGLPNGVTAAFNPNPATSTSTLTLTAGSTATTGTGMLTVTGTSGSLTQTTPLTLTVTSVVAVTLSQSSLSFGDVAVNNASAAKSVTLKNTGTATLNLNGIAASANFAISANTCGGTLASGKTCKVSVAFTPTQVGASAGTLSFTDNAANSPQSVALSGTGVADATLAPASATYAVLKVGMTSAARTFTLTNNQPVALTSVAVSTTGDFAVVSTTCGTSLAAKGKCTVSVTFTPTATGTRTGQLVVNDSAGNSPQTSNLNGMGK